jgi:hypothetical protein
MILYFNTKIIAGNIYENNLNSYYPTMNPKEEVIVDKYEFNLNILKTTIKSYSKLDFIHAIFNIEVLNSNHEKEIKDLISKFFSKISVEIQFKRPSDIISWKKDIKRLSKYKHTPIFTVFNHDHIFLDYQLDTFRSIVNEVFNGDSSDYKKIFYYSHIPEFLSKILNTNRFNKLKITRINNLYSLKYINVNIDSFAIMTYDTLSYIFKSIIKYPNYIGRIDWQGLYFRKLKVEAFVYPREFFGHYEGYGHVTGTKLYKNFNIVNSINKLSIEDKLEFYYSKWLNNSFLYIRDFVFSKFFRPRFFFHKALENSFEIFKTFYLEEDLKYQIIDQKTFDILIPNLRSKIYRNANDIYLELKTDNELGFRFWTKLKASILMRLKSNNAYYFYIKYFK